MGFQSRLGLGLGRHRLILFSATSLYKLLGQRVLVAVERLMGMLLVALSVQMFLDGIAAYLASPNAASMMG